MGETTQRHIVGWETNPVAAYNEAVLRVKRALEQKEKVLSLFDISLLQKLPSDLANLKFLITLDIDGTQIADLSPIAKLSNLQNLYISNTKVTNIELLGNLTGLQSLDINRTKIRDLSPLRRMHKLRTLSFTDTSVSDLSTLTTLPKLESLYFERCPEIIDSTLIELSKIPNTRKRTLETLRYLRGLTMAQEEEKPTPPPVPAQSKAPLQVTLDDGVLKALPPHAPELASAEATNRAREAYDALKEMAEAIQGNLAGGNYPHVSQAMAAYCRAFGDSFQRLRQVALGMHGERMKAQAATAHEFMPDVLAADMKGLAAAHAIFLQRFDEWQEFLSDVKKNHLDPEKSEAARLERPAINMNRFKDSVTDL